MSLLKRIIIGLVIGVFLALTVPQYATPVGIFGSKYSCLTLAAVHTLGIHIDFWMALVLSIVAAVSASGTSGVAGGSLLLIPLASSLFGIPDDVAMQVVTVGFVIGVLQDSVETALNSSTDVLFTAVFEFRQWRKSGREIVID